MEKVEGLACRACGRGDAQPRLLPGDEPTVACVTGNALETAPGLEPRLAPAVRIRPRLAAFERALADLETATES